MASIFYRILGWATPRMGEVCKLATFLVCYMIYAWRAFHAQVCGKAVGGVYPCPPAPFQHRLLHHARRPGDLLSVVFLWPRDPADRHDGLSCVTFLLGGILAVAFGPARGDARRSCNWRLAWLLMCVLLPKGFLIRYGLLHPAASLGAAVNTMLQRHTALMVWLSLAFPVVWRRQALLAAVYASHMLLVIRLAATRAARPWPYDDPLYAPAAVSARLVALSSLSVAVAAAWDWRRARSESTAELVRRIWDPLVHSRRDLQRRQGQRCPGARAAAGKKVRPALEVAGPCEGGTAAATAVSATSFSGGGRGRWRRLLLGCLTGGRGAAVGGGSAASGGAAPSGAVRTEAARKLGSLRQRRAAAAAAAAAARACGGGCGQGQGVGVAAMASAVGAPLAPGLRGCCSPLKLPPPPAPPGCAGRERDSASMQRLASRAASVPVAAPPSDGPAALAAAAAAAAAPGGWCASRYHLPPPPRYRSVTRPARMLIKMGGVTPGQLDPRVVTTLSEDLLAQGFLLMDVAVRSGCIEVILELQDVGGGGGGQQPDLVRRVVAALAAATGGAAAATAATAARPVRVYLEGVSYLLTYDTAAAAATAAADVRQAHGGSGGVNDGWRMWRAGAGPIARGGDGCGGDGGCGGGGGSLSHGPVGYDIADVFHPDEQDRLAIAQLDGSPSLPGPGPPANSRAWRFGGADGGAAATQAPSAPAALTGDAVEPGALLLAVVLPSCAAAPPPANAPDQAPVAGAVRPVATAAAAAAGAEQPLEYRLVLSLPFSRRNSSCLEGGGAPAPGAATAAVATKAAVLAPAAGPEVPRPEVLAWQCGRFLKVLDVEEAPGSSGPESTLLSYRVRLDAREVSHGLITFGIRAGDGGGGFWAAAAAGAAAATAPPLVYAARALMLPPALAAVAEELAEQLAEDALEALAEDDIDGVASVTEFLTDLAAWLPPLFRPLARDVAAPSTQTLQPLMDWVAADPAAAPPGGGADTVVSSAACTAAWGYSDGSVGLSEWDSEVQQRRSLRAFSGSGRWVGADPAGPTDEDVDRACEHVTPWDWSAPTSGQLPDVSGDGGGGGGLGPSGGPGGVDEGSGGGGGAGGTPAVRVGGSQVRGRVEGDPTRGADQAGELAVPIAADAWDAAEAEAEAGDAPLELAAGQPPPPCSSGGGGGEGAGSRMLDGGRLDLRDVVADAAASRAAQFVAGARGARDGQHWRLLEYAVHRGWPAATGLLLALPRGDGDDNDGSWRLGSLDQRGQPPSRRGADVRDAGHDGGEGAPSLLHLAVSSGVPAVVDAVVAAGQLYGTRSHPFGVYGTWATTMPPEASAASAAALTPLDVAAALPDCGAMLSYILRRYPDAAAEYELAGRPAEPAAR